MAYEERDMAGTLFREQDKTSERAPDYTGKLTIGGTTYRLAAWLRDGKRGKFLSLAASLPDQGRRQREPEREDDDRIPF